MNHKAPHPGARLAFADVSGQDAWRNQVAIRHAGFTESSAERKGRRTFADESHVEIKRGQNLCLRRGLPSHDAPSQDVDLAADYHDFLKQLPGLSP